MISHLCESNFVGHQTHLSAIPPGFLSLSAWPFIRCAFIPILIWWAQKNTRSSSSPSSIRIYLHSRWKRKTYRNLRAVPYADMNRQNYASDTKQKYTVLKIISRTRWGSHSATGDRYISKDFFQKISKQFVDDPFMKIQCWVFQVQRKPVNLE